MKYVADPQMAPNLVPEIFSNSFLFFPSRFYFIIFFLSFQHLKSHNKWIFLSVK